MEGRNTCVVKRVRRKHHFPLAYCRPGIWVCEVRFGESSFHDVDDGDGRFLACRFYQPSLDRRTDTRRQRVAGIFDEFLIVQKLRWAPRHAGLHIAGEGERKGPNETILLCFRSQVALTQADQVVLMSVGWGEEASFFLETQARNTREANGGFKTGSLIRILQHDLALDPVAGHE
ncbi:MAG: hypothetical protein Q9196_002430 [Gyalolechia fulgens]